MKYGRLLLVAVTFATAACGSSASTTPAPPVVVDGSSTLAPPDAGHRHRVQEDVSTDVALTTAGTVEGFTRFCRGGVDVVDASRAVTATERTACASGGVEFIELPVAYDALTVIVHPAVAIDDGDDSVGRGRIAPSPEAVGRGVYRPFARPMFVYVNKARLDRPEVKGFVDTYLRRAVEVAGAAGTVPLSANSYQLATQRLAKGVTGTMYNAPEDAKLGLDLLMNR
jgi:ABC-type phosphate transport system substrate-binding protein